MSLIANMERYSSCSWNLYITEHSKMYWHSLVTELLKLPYNLHKIAYNYEGMYPLCILFQLHTSGEFKINWIHSVINGIPWPNLINFVNDGLMILLCLRCYFWQALSLCCWSTALQVMSLFVLYQHFIMITFTPY